MTHLHRALAVALGLVATTPGCATILNGKQKTIFLRMSEADAATTTFYLDGKQVPWKMTTYNVSETGRTSESVVYSVTSLPALTVTSPGRYVTLTADFGNGRREEVLLKRDLMKGYKFYLYLDWMTFGIGTMIDIFGDGLYGMEEVQVSSTGRAVVGAVVPAEVRR